MTGNNQQGFTLIEMLVAVTLFAIAGTVLSMTLVSFGRLHRKVAYSSVLNGEMRSIGDILTRRSRLTHLTFPSAGFATKVSSFQMTSKDPSVSGFEQIRLGSGAECSDASVTNCLVVDVVDGFGASTTHAITGSRVNVTRFDVYPRPLTSPFAAVANPPTIQPFVTVRIGLQYAAPDPRDVVALDAQTTLVFRDYQR